MENIERTVREELGKIVEADMMAVSADEDITKLAQLDSLSVLELMDIIEERFDIEISLGEISKIGTIADVVRLISARVKKG